jgi:segregation and condensation protein A
MTDATSDWFAAPSPAPDEEILYVDVDGYEGPLDLLLDLARRQKVDLAKISVLALAEQYLEFIETVRAKRIEIAADYLVMAAWLAYLKSRLMVPGTESGDEPTGEMMAALLQFRRGLPEQVVVTRRHLWEASLYDLLKAYAGQRERTVPVDYTPRERTVWALQDARDILQRLIGDSMDWVPLETYLDRYLSNEEERRTARASTFASSLELVRQGHVEVRQSLAYGPLYLRRRQGERPKEN